MMESGDLVDKPRLFPYFEEYDHKGMYKGHFIIFSWLGILEVMRFHGLIDFPDVGPKDHQCQ